MPRHLFQGGRLDQIIRIKLENKLSARFTKAGVARGAQALVLGVIYDADARVFAAKLFQNLQRLGIRGTVVDDEPLPLLQRLAKYGFNRLMKNCARVVEGRDDGHHRRRGKIIRTKIKAGSRRRSGRVGVIRFGGIDHNGFAAGAGCG